MDDDILAELWLALRRDASAMDSAYRRGVVRNLRRMDRRRGGRRVRREQAWARESPVAPLDPSEALERRERVLALREALERLGPDERELVVARYGEGRPATELAAGRGVSSNTMRWRLKEALRRLRVLLTPMHEPSMRPDQQIQALVQAIEHQLGQAREHWSGRVVLHLQPSPERTNIERVELLPPGPRRVGMQLRKTLLETSLPGCDAPPFEMHFDISP